MAGDFRLVLKSAGIRELLRSPGVAADLARRAQRVAAAAGPGHRVESSMGRNRARCAVIATTREAEHRELVDRVLTRAFYSARG